MLHIQEENQKANMRRIAQQGAWDVR
jgi:hypothetical protein